MDFVALNIVGLAASLFAIVASLISKFIVERRSIQKRSIKINIGGHSIEIKSDNVQELERVLEEVRKLDRNDRSGTPSSGAKQ
jgi:hypothetical protein